MVDILDYPDYQVSVIPGVVRWAPGTEFGSIEYGGNVLAGAVNDVIYAFPDDGYVYILDKWFLWTTLRGNFPISIAVCFDMAVPVWHLISLDEVTQAGFMKPFDFVAMALSHPMALKFYFTNYSNRTVWEAFMCTLYRYLVE